MADNKQIPAQGTGATTPTIATDEIGGVDYQRVKVNWGVDGATVDASASNPLPVVQTGTPGLPTGAATESTSLAGNVLAGAVTETAPATDTASSGLNGRLQRVAQRLTSLIAQIPATLGQKTMANSLAVTVASDQSAVPVSNATLPLPAGAATSAIQTDGTQRSRLVDGAGTNLLTIDSSGRAYFDLRTLNGTAIDRNTGVVGNGTQRVVLATDQAVLTNPQPANVYVQGAQVDVNGGNRSNSTMRVVLATDQPQLANAFFVTQLAPVQTGTATLANVAGSASSVTLQASNAGRKGLVIVNDSTAILYVKFGSAASTTSFTYFLAGSVGGVPATLELPFVVYTGIVTGIWASAVGSARVTEIT